MFRVSGFALVVLAAVPATAQEASRDRAELDAAAGRGVPAAQDETAGRPERGRSASPPRQAALRDEPAARASRPVRVILSSPYGR